jgi:hypothetical protein
MKSERDYEYSPEAIRFYLDHWRELRAAAEGGTGGLNGNGAGGGRDRLALACLLADLEGAADKLPLEWTGTLHVYRAQGRSQVWVERRQALESVAEETAILRMARSLGWQE